MAERESETFGGPHIAESRTALSGTPLSRWSPNACRKPSPSEGLYANLTCLATLPVLKGLPVSTIQELAAAIQQRREGVLCCIRQVVAGPDIARPRVSLQRWWWLASRSKQERTGRASRTGPSNRTRIGDHTIVPATSLRRLTTASSPHGPPAHPSPSAGRSPDPPPSVPSWRT